MRILALFCLAVALIGAALTNPLVEAASNAGFFGPGSYTDRSMADIIPVLALGAVCAAFWMVVQARKSLGYGDWKPAWLEASARALNADSVQRLLPVIFVLQMFVLFAMETLEQLAVYGHTLGPTIWLGAPILISLGAHAVSCALVAFLGNRALHRCTQAVVRFVRLLRQIFTLLAPHGPQELLRTFRSADRYHLVLVCCRSGERAPPLAA